MLRGGEVEPAVNQDFAVWDQGEKFFTAACKSCTDSAESLSMCATDDLKAALVYAESQLWLGRRGKAIKRWIEKQLTQRTLTYGKEKQSAGGARRTDQRTHK